MIVVTGGAGFIGSCIVAKLNTFGWGDIIIVDQIEKGDPKTRNIENKKYVEFIDKTDFLAQVNEDRLGPNIEAIIHMGACSDTTGTDAKFYEENNFQYTRCLAEWCLKKGVRFIYASSAATYGAGELGYSDDVKMLRHLKPLNLYGESKQKFDLWAQEQDVLDKIVGLKFFNVFGPNEYHKADMRSVIAKSYDRVKNEGRIGLFKSYHPGFRDGEQKRDFIYVKDAVDVVIFFLENPEINGLFNLGTGHARTWNELAEAIFEAAGRKVHIEYIDMPEHLRPRYQYFTEAKMDKLRAAGYTRPFMGIKEAVRDYAGYLNSNKHY